MTNIQGPTLLGTVVKTVCKPIPFVEVIDRREETMNKDKELAWEAWKEAANTNSSMSELSNLEERTQRQLFTKWWDRNHD